MTWTDDRVELLKGYVADGLSCSQIAAELGDVTRNGVIGKIHRLGIGNTAPRQKPMGNTNPTPRGTPRKHQRRFAKTSTAHPLSPRRRLIKNEVTLVNEPEPQAMLPTTDDLEIPTKQRCTLMALTEDTCRWPVGDVGTPEFFFCGAQTITSLPYCAYHSRIAYRPAESRSRRPWRSYGGERAA